MVGGSSGGVSASDVFMFMKTCRDGLDTGWHFSPGVRSSGNFVFKFFTTLPEGGFAGHRRWLCLSIAHLCLHCMSVSVSYVCFACMGMILFSVCVCRLGLCGLPGGGAVWKHRAPWLYIVESTRNVLCRRGRERAGFVIFDGSTFWVF